MEIFGLGGCGSVTLDDYERCQAAIIIVIDTCAVLKRVFGLLC